MTDMPVAVGDRVKVLTFEGVVQYVNSGGKLDVGVTVGGESYVVEFIPPALVERLPDPIDVGDLVDDVEALDALPPGTVVVDVDGDAFQKIGDDWHLARNDTEDWAVSQVASLTPRVAFIPHVELPI